MITVSVKKKEVAKIESEEGRRESPMQIKTDGERSQMLADIIIRDEVYTLFLSKAGRPVLNIR